MYTRRQFYEHQRSRFHSSQQTYLRTLSLDPSNDFFWPEAFTKGKVQPPYAPSELEDMNLDCPWCDDYDPNAKSRKLDDGTKSKV